MPEHQIGHPLMFLIRLVALVSLLYLPTLGAVAADACTAPEAALAYLLDRQEDIDELRAGGQGPLRIAYLHTPSDTHRNALTGLAEEIGIELRSHQVANDGKEFPAIARRIADWHPDWVLVSAAPVWHGAILTGLSRAAVPAPQVNPFARAAKQQVCRLP